MPWFLLTAFALGMLGTAWAGPVYMADGFKVGEVTADSAIVWTRLTEHPERNVDGQPFAPEADRVPEGLTLDGMEGAAPGTPGEVRVVYWAGDGAPRETGWQAVDPEADFTRQFRLAGLTPGQCWCLRVEGRAPGRDAPSVSLEGGFGTAPAATDEARVCFTVVTGQEYHRRDDGDRGHRIYRHMAALAPDFFVHTGDIEYYDKPGPLAKSAALARFKWNRLYALPNQRAFHLGTPAYFIKDDHDTLKDDCWPGQSYGDLTWEEGLAIFREQVPMGDRTYRTARWGRDLQVWLVEGRDFRSENDMPDGPEKTIWGAEQKQWFLDTVRASDATFRVLISPTPLVGPDRPTKNDNHSNAGFQTEGDELRGFIASQRNMYVVCGDRHWQYVSVHPASGVTEVSCGPTSNAHAGGFSEDQRTDMHRYLRVAGGFLEAVVDRTPGPTLMFRHHDVDGAVVNEYVCTAR